MIQVQIIFRLFYFLTSLFISNQVNLSQLVWKKYTSLKKEE